MIIFGQIEQSDRLVAGKLEVENDAGRFHMRKCEAAKANKKNPKYWTWSVANDAFFCVVERRKMPKWHKKKSYAVSYVVDSRFKEECGFGDYDDNKENYEAMWGLLLNYVDEAVTANTKADNDM